MWLCRFTMERAAARLAERAKVEAQANDAAGHEAGLGQLRSRLKGVQNQLSNFGTAPRLVRRVRAGVAHVRHRLVVESGEAVVDPDCSLLGRCAATPSASPASRGTCTRARRPARRGPTRLAACDAKASSG